LKEFSAKQKERNLVATDHVVQEKRPPQLYKTNRTRKNGESFVNKTIQRNRMNQKQDKMRKIMIKKKRERCFSSVYNPPPHQLRIHQRQIAIALVP
jgi:hypothetical protein